VQNTSCCETVKVILSIDWWDIRSQATPSLRAHSFKILWIFIFLYIDIKIKILKIKQKNSQFNQKIYSYCGFKFKIYGY
jgi:hypothetical protein